MEKDNLRYRNAPQRRAEIMDALSASGFLTFSDLAERLGVSEMTIRRDVRVLHQNGDVIASRGALRLPTSPGDLPRDEYTVRAQTAASEKIVVGTLAAEEIRSDDVIAIDAGTTAYQVAKALPPGFVGTVVTHSIPIIDLMLDRPEIKTIALGGDIHPPSRALVGSSTIENVRRLRVRTFFLGAAAVDERGLYASADVERQVKTTLMEIADRIVLVIDHSKFEATAPVLLCDWNRIDCIVSDTAPPSHIRDRLIEIEKQVIFPKKNS